MTKMLLDIIRAEWVAGGNRGPLTKEFVQKWRRSHPAYHRVKLYEKVYSGSTLALLPGELSPFSRIIRAWIDAGNPGPGKPGFSWDALQVFADSYTDEFFELEGEGRKFIGLTSEGKGFFHGKGTA